MTDSIVRTSDTLGDLAEALTKAQAEFGDITKNRTANVGTYSYKYADLTDVLDAVRDPLAKNGLALLQPITANESHQYLATRLIHTSGEWIESLYPLASYAKPQDMGSAITYARRYAVTSLLGIAAEDDDGHAAQKAQSTSPRTTEQREGVAVAAPASVPVQPASPSPASDEQAELRRTLWSAAQSVGFDASDYQSYIQAKYPLYEGGTKDLTADELETEIEFFGALDDLRAQKVKDALVAGTFVVAEAVADELTDDERNRYRRRLYQIAKEVGHDAQAVKDELAGQLSPTKRDVSTKDFTRAQWEWAIAYYERQTKPPTPTES